MQGKDSTDRMPAYVGIDVCKAWPDVYVSQGGRHPAWRVAHTGTGLGELIRQLSGFSEGSIAGHFPSDFATSVR